MEKAFRISVIVSVYNTQEYIRESLESIVKQSIGFEDCIQLILINDASTDNSAIICKEYEEKYPDNVLFLDLEQNRGLSAVRNLGASVAKGDYLTFFDSDDLWSANAFEEAVAFLDAHRDEIDFVSSNEEFFEGRTGAHILNVPAKENMIVDIQKQCQYIRSRGASIIIKTEVTRKYSFDIQQKGYEDTRYVAEVLCEKGKYGMLANTVYYFRKRKAQTSLTQTAHKNIDQYTSDMELFFSGVYEASCRAYGCLIPMFQLLIAYVLAYRFGEHADMSESEIERYEAILHTMLDAVEDKYIIMAPNAKPNIRIAMLSFKNRRDIRSEMILRGQNFYFGNNVVLKAKENILSLWSIASVGDLFVLEGKVNLDIEKNYEVVAETQDGKQSPCTVMRYFGRKSNVAFRNYVWNHYGFVVSVPKNEAETIRFLIKMDGDQVYVPILICGDCKSWQEGQVKQINLYEINAMK